MRLFKYYGFNSGLEAIKSSKLGFRSPSNFNDPFELTSLFDEEAVRNSKGFVGGFLNELRDRVYVSSLTRSYNNALMWSHYGDEHKGFVVEYDVDCAFLNSRKYCLIPVYDGSVIYQNNKPKRPVKSKDLERLHDIYLQAMGAGDELDDEAMALARRLYLTKQSVWSYEEEVRVVKIIDSMFEESCVFQNDLKRSFSFVGSIPGLVLFDFPVKVKNVYLGAKSPYKLVDGVSWVEKIKSKGIGTYQMEIDRCRWDLKRVKI